MNQVWKKCSRCKKDIPVQHKYFVCDVSTCNSKRTGYVFCSLHCWESHLPFARHRDASAIEKVSPSVPAPPPAVPGAQGARRIVRTPSPSGSTPAASAAPENHEILIVASKLKAYIKSVSGMNTSGGVLEALSDQVRLLCRDAIDEARAEGRKTVMDRDFKKNRGS